MHPDTQLPEFMLLWRRFAIELYILGLLGSPGFVLHLTASDFFTFIYCPVSGVHWPVAWSIIMSIMAHSASM